MAFRHVFCFFFTHCGKETRQHLGKGRDYEGLQRTAGTELFLQNFYIFYTETWFQRDVKAAMLYA